MKYKRKINIFVPIYHTLIFFPIVILTTIVAAVTTIIFTPLYPKEKISYYPAILWAKIICTTSFVKVKITGEDNYDPNKSYIFVANHQSIFDILIIYGWLQSRFKWIMKKEIRRIPLIGMACDRLGHIFIDRTSGRKAKESIEKAKLKLRDGGSLVVFPEGTRTKDGEVAKFKNGAFSIAKDIHLPIIPITIKGAYEVLPTKSGFIKPGTIEMIIHKPIDTSDMCHENIGEYKTNIENIIKTSLL